MRTTEEAVKPRKRLQDRQRKLARPRKRGERRKPRGQKGPNQERQRKLARPRNRGERRKPRGRKARIKSTCRGWVVKGPVTFSGGSRGKGSQGPVGSQDPVGTEVIDIRADKPEKRA